MKEIRDAEKKREETNGFVRFIKFDRRVGNLSRRPDDEIFVIAEGVERAGHQDICEKEQRQRRPRENDLLPNGCGRERSCSVMSYSAATVIEICRRCVSLSVCVCLCGQRLRKALLVSPGMK